MQSFLKCDYSSRKEVKSLLALLIITVIGDILTTHCSPTNIYDATSQTNHHCTAQLTEYLKTFLYPYSNVSTVLSATVILRLFTLTLANAISNTTVHDPVSYIGSTFCMKTSVIRQLIHREYLRHWAQKKKRVIVSANIWSRIMENVVFSNKTKICLKLL
jgi:hypothetical protein